ncbi:FAS-associated factor 1-like [Saccostrea echinata]|uniref:FAS-associated factor 1-like n=1 Tax=Saccostrea echinata TaxID=191078 RepID=UPI002A838D81|nr:FAS-associated factor 1-like [Saccostrea echinata]
MAEGERDQVLAEFQAFTALEDIDTCIQILETNDWNLMRAVNSVMPGSDGGLSPTGREPPPSGFEDISPPPYSASSPDNDNNIADSRAFFDPSSASECNVAIPSTSNSSPKRRHPGGGPRPRMLNFKVEYRDQNFYFNVGDNEKIGKVKELLSQKIGVSPEKQSLRGWSTRKTRVEDDKILRDLHLPKENTLFLLTPDVSNPTLVKPTVDVEMESLTEALNRTYALHINFTENGEVRHYKLNMPGSKTIGEVKSDVYALTNLPARHQIWTGWPDSAKNDDSMTIGCCGLNYPIHNLELTKANIITRPKKVPFNEVVQEIEISDDDDDDLNPMEDDMFDHDDIPSRGRPTPLMPESVNDEVEALEHFTKEFRERYGETHPVFYVGSLEDAIKEALNGKAKDRKLLAVYLHHDGSILSNVFCSQILCSDSVVNYLSSNFITWAWDMTHETNCARLITMATRHFGNVVAGQIRCLKPEQLPMLLVISRARATNEVIDMIPGSVTLDELMTRLIHDSESFQQQQRIDIQDEEEREARDTIRREQEEAFKESLAADRKKVEEQRLQQEMEIKKQEEEERQRREEEERKMAIQQSAALQIPEEPPESSKEAVARLRFRTPTGDVKLRRFRASEPLRNVLFYLTSEGFHIEDYKILTTFPRRDISQLDEMKTLEELKLYPQETLILEEK